MRRIKADEWRQISEDPTKWVDFVVTLYDNNMEVRFSSINNVCSIDGLFPGLMTDMSGIGSSIDIRGGVRSGFNIPTIEIHKSAVEDAFGGSIPDNFSGMNVEISIVGDGIPWDGRIVIISNVRIDPASVRYKLNGSISFSVTDILDLGKTLIPRDIIDVSKLSWNQSYVKDDINGMAFPVCYGHIHRMSPIMAYEDHSVENVRRYILCGHPTSGTTATVHRNNKEYSGNSDISKNILTDKTTDGIVFSYIETDIGTGSDEDIAASPPVECRAISFDATSGIEASAGWVLGDMLRRWSDIDWNIDVDNNVSILTDSLRDVNVSVLINPSVGSRPRIGELVDRRITSQIPIGVSRFGASVAMTPLVFILNESFGYVMGEVSVEIGNDANIVGDIREYGDVYNRFDVAYRPRGDDGEWEKVLSVSPNNNYKCDVSRQYYGLREMDTVELHDVYSTLTANMVLDYLMKVYLFPWYTVDIRVGFEHSFITPGMKIRMYYGNDDIMTSLGRFRDGLKYNTSEKWRDAVVTRVTYDRFGLVLTVIF